MKLSFEQFQSLDKQSAIALVLETGVALKAAIDIIQAAEVEAAKRFPHSWGLVVRARDGLEKAEADSTGFSLICEVENDKLRHIAYGHAADILELFAEHEKHLLECIQRAQENTDPEDEPGPIQIATPLAIDLGKNTQQTTIGYSLKHKGKKKRLIPDPTQPDLFKKPAPKSPPIVTPPPAEQKAEDIGHSKALVLRDDRTGAPVGDVIDITSTARPARQVRGALPASVVVEGEEIPVAQTDGILRLCPPPEQAEEETAAQAKLPIELRMLSEIAGFQTAYSDTGDGRVSIPGPDGRRAVATFGKMSDKHWSATVIGEDEHHPLGTFKSRKAAFEAVERCLVFLCEDPVDHFTRVFVHRENAVRFAQKGGQAA